MKYINLSYSFILFLIFGCISLSCTKTDEGESIFSNQYKRLYLRTQIQDGEIVAQVHYKSKGIIDRIDYYDNGTLDRTEIFNYEGDKVSEIFYSNQKAVYSYDTHGRVQQISYCDFDGSECCVDEYFYGGYKGNDCPLVRVETKGDDDYCYNYTRTYIYINNNNCSYFYDDSDGEIGAYLKSLNENYINPWFRIYPGEEYYYDYLHQALNSPNGEQSDTYTVETSRNGYPLTVSWSQKIDGEEYFSNLVFQYHTEEDFE